MRIASVSEELCSLNHGFKKNGTCDWKYSCPGETKRKQTLWKGDNELVQVEKRSRISFPNAFIFL